jgi:tetratricopeptide (TPR) repeat protein
MAPVQAKMTAMSTAMREKKWDEAMDDLAAVEKLIPENRRDSMTVTLEVNRFRILLGKKDYPAAYKLAAKISDAHKNSAALQNYLAWQIVADKTIEKPDLELAETLANRANEAAKGQDPGILDTQARVLFLKGQKDEAIKTQARAVALAEPDGKQALQLTLDSYKKGELPVVN